MAPQRAGGFAGGRRRVASGVALPTLTWFRENPPMTEAMINLGAIVVKTPDADVFAGVIGFTAEAGLQRRSLGYCASRLQ